MKVCEIHQRSKVLIYLMNDYLPRILLGIFYLLYQNLKPFYLLLDVILEAQILD